MKKTFIIILCTAVLFCGCVNGTQGSLEATTPVVTITPSLTPTPTLPPDRGPSAVFTATLGPTVTPIPTPTATLGPTVTPIPTATPNYYSKESKEKMIKMLSGYKFDFVSDVRERDREEFTSDEEYIEYIQNECERLYEENLEYLRTHKIDALYVRYLMPYGYFDRSVYVYFKITYKSRIKSWIENSLNTRMIKKSDYSFSNPPVINGLTGNEYYTQMVFCVEKNGVITKMFEINNEMMYGVSYFEEEPYRRLPYSTECPDELARLYELGFINYIEESLIKNFETGEEVELIFEEE